MKYFGNAALFVLLGVALGSIVRQVDDRKDERVGPTTNGEDWVLRLLLYFLFPRDIR